MPAPRALAGSRGIARWSLAVAAVAAATGLSWALWPLITPTATPLFFAAVVLASRYGGTGPGLLATGLAALIAELLFYPPLFELTPGLGILMRLGLFLGAALLVHALNAQQRAARAHLQALAETRERVLRYEQASRAAAESAQRRATILAEASARLAAESDPDEALAHVARLVVPELGHCAAIDLVDGGDGLRRVAVAHADPEEERRLAALPFPFPPDARWLHGGAPVLQRGEPELHGAIDEEKFDALAPDARHPAELRALGLTS